MKKYIALGMVIGLILALGIGWGASVVLAQGPTPPAPTQAQMQAMHEAMHGAGSWDAMARQMEQFFGPDWFSRMHGPNGMTGTVPSGMNGTSWQNHMSNFGGMMGRPPADR